jgi:hypothetical protein
MNQRVYGFGQLPPPDLAWWVGKSKSTIDFVSNAEKFLNVTPLAKFSFDIEQRHEALRHAVEGIKFHGYQVPEHLTVEVFLASAQEPDLPNSPHI